MFWDTFSDLCLSVGFSPNAVAKELKIPSGSVTAWKNGAVPRAKTLKKIADYFGVSTEFILYGENFETTPDKKEKSSVPEGTERIPGYSNLSETNKAIVDTMIAQLLAAQSSEE